MQKTKEFRDPVHGYITIPDDYCTRIIDTTVFQRLREIEQTGMRVLFPGARHCRFSHSLGTYHLGRKAFKHFRENAHEFFENITSDMWHTYEQTFSMACLLHDCAHAPFSHTLERYYDYVSTEVPSRLQAPLLVVASDKSFESDYTNRSANKPSPHEKASAIIALRYYSEAIVHLGGDPLLVCRMILGCRHLGATSGSMHLENCLISLLNGKAVDVDKLDYIMRDTWASGVDNVSIDTHRLLSSLTYDVGYHSLAFRKGAISVLQSVVDARNYLYRWVFAHHKVTYNQYLLRTAVMKLARLLAPDDSDCFLTRFFSLDAFESDVQIGDGLSTYLPTDQDLTVLLKRYRNKIPQADEYLSRRHRRKALWKTSVEFDRIFADRPSEDMLYIESEAVDTLSALVKDSGEGAGFVVERIPRKFVVIQTGDLLVQLAGETCPYAKLFPQHAVSNAGNAFYVFAPTEHLDRREEFITALQKISA